VINSGLGGFSLQLGTAIVYRLFTLLVLHAKRQTSTA
jgi:hypothetical protein